MSSLTSLAVKQSQVRHTTSKPAPTTAAQQKEKAKQHEDNQEEINAKVTDWFNETMAKASVLAAKFNKKPRYTGERKECTWENFGLTQIVDRLSQEVQYQFPI